VTVGDRPLSIGRGPDNDLVIPDPMVSWEHLKVWAERGQVWCSDAGSTNGTFVNGNKVRGSVALDVGDRITVGDDKLKLKLQVSGTLVPKGPSRGQTLAVEEVATGVRHPFRTTRFTIGSANDCDLRVPRAHPYAAEFAMHGPDDVWLLVDTEDRQLDIGQKFEVAGLQLRLVVVDAKRAPTVQPQKDRFPYKLTATLDGPTGPVAELTNLNTGNTCRVEAETRAILLYLLGRQAQEDKGKELGREAMGWCPDDDVIVGVWGRSGLPDGANRLKVLVHRLRAEFKRSGFDPWIIERRRRYIRVRVREATAE
jgi:hypothetical protein